MELKIGSKIYNVEYNIEASLCNECIEKTIEFLLPIGSAENRDAIKGFVSTLSSIPDTTITLLYAGLLAHHGEDGDGTVTSKADAKKLIKEYISENKDNEKGNYHYLIGAFIEQMENDGFFKLIGLEAMMKNMTAKPQKKAKAPKDHLKAISE